jgi:hypothetical protein
MVGELTPELTTKVGEVFREDLLEDGLGMQFMTLGSW